MIEFKQVPREIELDGQVYWRPDIATFAKVNIPGLTLSFFLFGEPLIRDGFYSLPTLLVPRLMFPDLQQHIAEVVTPLHIASTPGWRLGGSGVLEGRKFKDYEPEFFKGVPVLENFGATAYEGYASVIED
jgi:hypothetical protein